MLIVGLMLLLLLLSFLLNVYWYKQKKQLEEKVYLSKWRLVAFAGVTGELLKEKGALTRDNVIASKMLGFPYQDGKNFVISPVSKYGWAIKYLFDTNGKLVGWEEYPKVVLFEEDGSERSLSDVVYENDGIRFE